VAPRGPLSLPPGGAHWYALWRIGYPDPATFRSTFELVSGWLDELLAGHDLPFALGGFSQGAVMTYALGLGKGRPKPAALLAFSGFVPTVEGFELDLEGRLPRLAIGHGVYDQVIEVEWGRRARDLLAQAGADVLYREYPLPHAIDPRFLAELRPWLAESLR
jgi:phospholipase/carboxylesterase